MLPLEPLQAAVTGVTRPLTGPSTASLILQIQRSQDKARGRAATPAQEEAGTAATSLAVPAAQQQLRSSSFSVRDTPAVSVRLAAGCARPRHEHLLRGVGRADLQEGEGGDQEAEDRPQPRGLRPQALQERQMRL